MKDIFHGFLINIIKNDLGEKNEIRIGGESKQRKNDAF
jgi:hypothetical protein